MNKSAEIICININKKAYMIFVNACEQINKQPGSKPEDALIPKDVIESQIVNYVFEHTDSDRDMIPQYDAGMSPPSFVVI